MTRYGSYRVFFFLLHSVDYLVFSPFLCPYSLCVDLEPEWNSSEAKRLSAYI